MSPPLECSLVSATAPTGENVITRGAKWSPDGSIFLANNDDGIMRAYAPQPGSEVPLEPFMSAKPTDTVYDFCWYPKMRRDEPASCCYLTSTRAVPMHLRDVVTGDVRASYRFYNHLDEVAAAYSVAFTPDGSEIFAGFENNIGIFDVSRPGRQISQRLLTTRKGKTGQKGIIGAITFCGNSFALGSYGRSIRLYERNMKEVACPVGQEAGLMGGVTQLEWPEPDVLISGHRSDDFIRIWDLRRPDVPRQQVARPARTNQRHGFSVVNKRIACGGTDGRLRLYQFDGTEDLSFEAHPRPCVSADLHPSGGWVLTSSGAREFPNYDVDSPRNTPDAVVEEVPERPKDSWLKVWAIPGVVSSGVDEPVMMEDTEEAEDA